MNKWDRFVEVFRYGENWITGHSNHDNARYFYRLVKMKPARDYQPGDSFDDYYNDQLGQTMTEVAHNAMDNNALTALSLGFLPGNPMFLLNALFRTPWLFLRDIDDTYDVKIVSEEGSRFLTWYVDAELFQKPQNFRRLKALGFQEYSQLVATPKLKETEPGFMDVLFELVQAVKTDAMMDRFLFDDPTDAGGYATVVDLRATYEQIAQPTTEEDQRHYSRLRQRIRMMPKESKRRVVAARKLLQKSLRTLRRDKESASDNVIEQIILQIQKLEFLETVDDRGLALLIEDADYRTEYDVSTWAKNEHLNASSPAQLKVGDQLTADILKTFAHAFMLDARDLAKVHHYEDTVKPEQAQFNFDLRRFRQQNPWLLHNPTNDVQKDYFARKLFINGAKDTGDWGDKGDVINCNTIYYGWRTSPDGKKQVFLIANMEGKPIDRCPLGLFLNLAGPWQVVVHSPAMTQIPAQLDKTFVIENFKNGEALLLEREL
jgi:hypothetical protein